MILCKNNDCPLDKTTPGSHNCKQCEQFITTTWNETYGMYNVFCSKVIEEKDKIHLQK